MNQTSESLILHHFYKSNRIINLVVHMHCFNKQRPTWTEARIGQISPKAERNIITELYGKQSNTRLKSLGVCNLPSTRGIAEGRIDRHAAFIKRLKI